MSKVWGKKTDHSPIDVVEKFFWDFFTYDFSEQVSEEVEAFPHQWMKKEETLAAGRAILGRKLLFYKSNM